MGTLDGMAATPERASDRHEDRNRSHEDAKQRVDRELIELLQELRVAIPGVQVLFAFLLTLPFAQGFGKLGGIERGAYLTSLLCAAAATALLIAPSAYHRLSFREGEKERMLFASNRMSITGLALLAIAISAAVFVIVGVVLGRTEGAVITALTALWFAWFWYGLPLARKLQS